MALPYFFSAINPAIVVMGALFLIFFSLLNYTFSKVLKDRYGNPVTATVGIISFCISVLIIYFGKDIIYNIIEGLRLSDTILYVLGGAIVLILLFAFRRRLRGCMLLMLVGAGLILIGAFTDWFYQKGFVIGLGILLLILGIWACSKKRTGFNLGRGFSFRRSKYSQGMRRGGQTSHKTFNRKTGKPGRVSPGSYVSKAAVQRYARRYGNRAARKRFG